MARSMEPYRRDNRPGWYVDLGYVRLPDGRKKRFRGLKCEGRRKEDARNWAYRERDRVAREDHRAKPDSTGSKEVVEPTVDDLFPEFMEMIEKIGGKRGTAGPHWRKRLRVAYCGTRGDAGWLRPRFGDMPVSSVNEESLDRLVFDMKDQGLSAQTIRHTLRPLQGILELAKRRRHIDEPPVFPSVHDPRARGRAYSFEEVTRILESARAGDDRQAYLFLLLGFHAGLYQEEIMGLERSDVNLDLGCLHIRRSATDSGRTKPPKTENRVRDIPMTPTLEAALRAHLVTIPVGIEFLFSRKVEGKHRRLKKEWIRWPVVRVLKAAGLPTEEPFRRMRRTFCTEAKQRVPEVLVTRWMGHSDRNVTDRHYVGDFPMDFQRQAIALLEQPVALLTRNMGAIWEPTLVPRKEGQSIPAS